MLMGCTLTCDDLEDCNVVQADLAEQRRVSWQEAESYAKSIGATVSLSVLSPCTC
jgi:hypothetical protein